MSGRDSSRFQDGNPRLLADAGEAARRGIDTSIDVSYLNRKMMGIPGRQGRSRRRESAFDVLVAVGRAIEPGRRFDESNWECFPEPGPDRADPRDQSRPERRPSLPVRNRLPHR